MFFFFEFSVGLFNPFVITIAYMHLEKVLTKIIFDASNKIM